MEKKEIYQSPINLAGGEERFVCPQSLVLNSYLGCSHQCVYCYARYLLEMYGHWKSIKPTDPEIVDDILKKSFDGKRKDAIGQLIRMKVPFRFSNLTDPFQEAERKYKATYGILQVLAKYQYPAILNTKGILQADDEYIELFKQTPVVIQETITTHDPDLASKTEPGAPSPIDRMAAVEKIAKAGIPTQVRYSPVYPLLADDPTELFRMASNAGAKDIICEFVRLSLETKWQKLLNDRLGFDYLQFLLDRKYPIVKYRHWWKVEKPFIFDEYKRFKSMAQAVGLNFYVCCEERPEINEFANCCGTSKYPGFERDMCWTIQMNGYRFGEEPITFDEYIDGTECPYTDDFKKFWDKGGFKGSMYQLVKRDDSYLISDIPEPVKATKEERKREVRGLFDE